MELLPSGQQNTTEVLWEDQQKINKFSSLINRRDGLTDDLDKLKQEKEYIDDLAMEIELLDEGEKIQYKIGEVFIFLNVEEATANIEKENETLDEKVSNLESEISEIDEKLLALKAHLYGRFGKNINLER